MQQQVPAGLLAKAQPAQAATASEPTTTGDPGQPPRIDPLAAAIAQAVNGALVPVLTQMLPAILGDTLTSALRAVTPRRDKCAECVRTRVMWSKKYGADAEAAHEAACAASGIAPDDPRAAQIDATGFLPEHLRPGTDSPTAMPAMYDSVAIHQGESKCVDHLVPEATGRRPFLVVSGPVTHEMLSQLR